MKINTGCFLDGCKCFDSDDEDGVEIKRDKEWVGLTDEELEFYTEELGQGELGRGVLRAVIDFLKEKNSTSEKNIQTSDNKETESARSWVGLTK